MPPKEKVLQTIELSGFQRGSSVILSWKMPLRNAPQNSVLHITRADIYRLAEPITSPQNLSEEEFASRSNIIGSYSITDKDFGGKQIQFVDKLQFAGQPARLRYAVRLVNNSGQKAAFSNFFLIEPTAKLSLPPSEVKVSVSQDALSVAWQLPSGNIDGSTPANIIGYNIYRSESEKVPAKLLNTSPVTDSGYRDEFFEFEKTYFYFVRAVSLGADGSPMESAESEIVKVTPKDTFPPTAPTALTIAASTNSISIFFPANPETDVEGYLIYRTTDDTIPKEKWELMTQTPIKTTTYKDEKVQPGTRYFYFVRAVDKYKNISEPSEVVSEVLP
ncbi:MAG TPA: hypothetical protein VNK26_03190 [Pyrinomonadaceae bacterium]|nr:hypothetical protein [Pyrinomonadaceae bacterium]